jgi:hypothetical protein
VNRRNVPVAAAAALFVAVGLTAIVVVAGGGGGSDRKHRGFADVDEAGDYGGPVRIVGADDLSAARRAASAYPEVMITVSADRIEIAPIDFPTSHSLRVVDRTGRLSGDVWSEVAGTLETLHGEDDTNEARVVIHADPDIPHGDIVKLMDVAKDAGFTKMALQTP